MKFTIPGFLPLICYTPLFKIDPVVFEKKMLHVTDDDGRQIISLDWFFAVVWRHMSAPYKQDEI